MKIIIRLILIATIAIANYIGFISQNWTLAIGISALCCLGILATLKPRKSCKIDKASTSVIAASASTTFFGDGN
ncbi:hypothetical protein [Litorilituus sediminis]|uniref:Uncharacterized protein n=1 Tax=Litorilituus sediminis TaxID=718192 RepID=A0A4P6P782_9GAMM|nr:hypothetical protein [Litorilituus sediminis]QBG36908.1 hypothetical protein EMK97_14855 [Litorilituus sediminis]